MLDIDFKNTKAVIFGKGPSFCNPIKQKNEIHICVNDSINSIDSPDVVVFNDMESLYKIEQEKLDIVKLIVLPYRPHSHDRAKNRKFIWEELKDTVNYKNEWFPYNLKSSPPFGDLPKFESALTSSNTAVEWAILMGIKEIKTYGIGGKPGYHSSFKKSTGGYNIERIRKEIEDRCSKNNVKLTML